MKAVFLGIKNSAHLGGTCLILISAAIVYFFPHKDFLGEAVSNPSSSIALSGSNSGSQDQVPTLAWQTLQSFDYVGQKVPDDLNSYLNKTIRIPGFAVPLSDHLSEVKEFLYVPNQMACIHVPAPPPHLVIYVNLDEGRSIRDLTGPLWLTGVLALKHSESTYGAAAFEITASEIEPYFE